jgi:hypothetical protein
MLEALKEEWKIMFRTHNNGSNRQFSGMDSVIAQGTNDFRTGFMPTAMKGWSGSEGR